MYKTDMIWVGLMFQNEFHAPLSLIYTRILYNTSMSIGARTKTTVLSTFHVVCLCLRLCVCLRVLKWVIVCAQATTLEYPVFIDLAQIFYIYTEI